MEGLMGRFLPACLALAAGGLRYGAYGGARTYQCFTGEDRRRVPDHGPKRD
jgi:hypothetical protein